MSRAKQKSSVGVSLAGDSLPPGWATTKLGEVVNLSPEKVEPSDDPTARYVGLEHIESGTRSITGNANASAVRSTKSVFRPGDVLYGKLRPYLNKVAEPDFAGVCSTDILVLQSTGAIRSDYLSRLLGLPKFIDFAMSNSTGINLPRASFKKLAEFSFALPPLAEQRRIVVRLEKLSARSRRARAALDAVPQLLAQARQALLAAAFRGDLTKDWRKKKTIPAQKKAPPEDAGMTLQVPKEWKTTRMVNLIPPGGIFDGPFGSHLKSNDYTEEGVRVVRLENIGHLEFDDEKRTFVSCKKYETLKRHTVVAGDIIFASFISIPPRVCILPALETPAIAKADCFCIRPNEQLVTRKFLCFQLGSPTLGHQLKDMIHGVTRPRVNTTQLREVPVAWCSLDEQVEIVRRLESSLAQLDKAAAAHAAALAELDRLDQSLLAQAFRGELVPQNPNDESAEKLLARILDAVENKTISKPQNK